MSDEKVSLADQIRDNLDAGLLPHVLPEKMGTGYGRGNPCDGCGQSIHPAQVEYEFRMHPNARMFRLHIGCVGMWLAELRRRGLVNENGMPSADDSIRAQQLAGCLAQAIRTHFPYMRCLSCLAHRLGITEPEMRSAAQMLVINRFKIMRRICYVCSHTGDTLVPGKDKVDDERVA